MAKICLIEDEAMIRETLNRILQKLGHEVVTCSDGAQGLIEITKNSYDIVLTDIIMPEVEGIEILQTVKKVSPTTKVIAMSGGGRVGNTDFLEIASSLGADAIIYKPVTKTDFMEALNKCLSERQQELAG